MNNNDEQLIECVRQKRDQFRVNLRKQKNEDIFKHKRQINLQLYELEKGENNLEKNPDQIFKQLITSIRNATDTRQFQKGLETLSNASSFLKDLYSKNMEQFNSFNLQFYRSGLFDHILIFLEMAASKSDLDEIFNIGISLYMMLSFNELDENFNALLYLNERFFQMMLSTQNYQVLHKTLIFLHNLAVTESFAYVMIFQIHITDFLNKAIEEQEKLFTYLEVQELWLSLLSSLLLHEFPKTYEQFKEQIWYVFSYYQNNEKQALKVFYAFSQTPNQQQKACLYLYKMDDLSIQLIQQMKSRNKLAIRTIYNFIQFLPVQEVFQYLQNGLVFDLNSALLFQKIDQDSTYYILEILSLLSQSNSPNITSYLIESELLQTCMTLSNLNENKNNLLLMNIIGNLCEADVGFAFRIIHDRSLGYMLKQLLQEYQIPLVLDGIVEMIRRVNRRLEVVTDEGEFTVLDKLIKQLNIDKCLEDVIKQNQDIHSQGQLQQYLDNIQM